MKRISFFPIYVCLLILFGASFAQTVKTPIRIKMAASTYTAQLRGQSGGNSQSSGQTVQGVYNSTINRHVFDIEKSGFYKLYVDPAGGSNYSLDATYSGISGKWFVGTDQFTVLDSSITLAKLAQSVHDAFNTAQIADSIVNHPDERYLTQSGSQLTFSTASLDTLLTSYKGIEGDTNTTALTRASRIDSIGAHHWMWNKKFLDARDFGLNPDSSGSWNTPALQAAVDSAWNPSVTDDRGYVYVPPGEYYLAAKPTPASGHRICINVRAGIRFFSDGSTSHEGFGAEFVLDSGQVASGDSIVMFADTGYEQEYVSKTGASATYWWHRGVMENIVIDCNGDNQEGYVTAIGIWQPGETAHIHNLLVRGIKGRGLWYDSPAPGFDVQNASFFAAESADTVNTRSERVGIWHKDGAGSFIQVSGDGMAPLHYIEDNNFYGTFINNKLESGAAAAPQPDSLCAFYVEDISLGGFTVVGSRFDRGTPADMNVVEIKGSTAADRPEIVMIGTKHSGFKNLIKWDINSSADSIKTSAAGAGNYTPYTEFLSGSHTIEGWLLFPYVGGGQGIRMIDHTDSDTVNVLYYGSTQRLHLRSPHSGIRFESDDGTRLADWTTSTLQFDKNAVFNAEAQILAGLKVGSTTGVEIDSIWTTGTANTDSLIIREGGREYFLERRDKP